MKAKLLDLMNQNMKKMIRDIWPNGILLKSNGIQQMVSNPLIVWENAPFWRILLMLWIWNVKMLSVWLSWLVLDHYLSWFCSYLWYSNAGTYFFFLENYTFELQDKCSWNVCANAFLLPQMIQMILWICAYFLYAYTQKKNAIQGYFVHFFITYIYEKTPDVTDTILSFYARPLKKQDVFLD